MMLVYLTVAWTAGIALAKVTNLPWQVLPVLGLMGFLGLILWRENARTRLGALCVLMLALGAGRFLLAVPHFDATSLATYNDAGWVTIEGVVTGEPDEREYCGGISSAKWVTKSFSGALRTCTGSLTTRVSGCTCSSRWVAVM